MKTTVSAISFQMTDAIEQHARQRVELSLATASEHINSVSVRLSDINGDRGGEDKRCRIVVSLKNLNVVVVDAVDRDLYVAIDHAVSRIKDTVWRHLKRQRTLRREFPNRGIRRLLA
jgi:putative sigma-54 modulation protein